MKKKTRTIYACFKDKQFFILTSDEHKFLTKKFTKGDGEVFSYKLSEEQCNLLFSNRANINTEYDWWKKNGKRL